MTVSNVRKYSPPKKKKPFGPFDLVPDDPKKVLTQKVETPGEISKRTGLNHKEVCESLVRWHQSGLIEGGKIIAGGVSIPAFRLKVNIK